MKYSLYDMHCHLDFAPNFRELREGAVAASAADPVETAQIAAISSTVAPSEFVKAKADLDSFNNVRIALGAHPWWIADGKIDEAELALFEKLACNAHFIGEVGLDFSGKRKAAKELQIEVFERVLRACDEPSKKVASVETSAFNKAIFIHAVKATTCALEILERLRIFDRNIVVFHWFSGSEEELKRAICDGAYFSVGTRMLKNPKAHAIAKSIPDERLLLETDSPSQKGEVLNITDWRNQLEGAVSTLSDIREIPGKKLACIMADNSKAIFES